MNTIDINQPIAEIINQHPELLDTFINLGFRPIANKAMRESVGRIISLKNGASMIGLPLDKLIQTLKWNGYKVIEEE
ncbi:MAG: DUF1858 domain-containing protein [Atopococcus tabaci]|uniref:DUF1858 domain-containing protein n=1 Tax=Atopococcus tabaci TaxID=269774 RepID=A0AA43UCR2_9LACT|nr:DUF1858 domain-containing protein [Atopococcus tabaci]